MAGAAARSYSLQSSPVDWRRSPHPFRCGLPPLPAGPRPPAGIPITLSLVYLEVARRVGLPMAGVNLPLHFMLRPAVGELEVLVDAFRWAPGCDRTHGAG